MHHVLKLLSPFLLADCSSSILHLTCRCSMTLVDTGGPPPFRPKIAFFVWKFGPQPFGCYFHDTQRRLCVSILYDLRQLNMYSLNSVAFQKYDKVNLRRTPNVITYSRTSKLRPPFGLSKMVALLRWSHL